MPPTEVEIRSSQGVEFKTGQHVGPLNKFSSLTLFCKAIGGKGIFIHGLFIKQVSKVLYNVFLFVALTILGTFTEL